MNVGEKIRCVRKTKSLTQAELGNKVNLSATRIGHYEMGIRTPKADKLQEIADVLNVPIEYFTDHKIDTLEDIFMILFEIEKMFGLSISLVEKFDKNGNKKIVHGLTTDDFRLVLYLSKWYKKKKELSDNLITFDKYEEWQTRFRFSLKEEMEKDLKNTINNA